MHLRSGFGAVQLVVQYGQDPADRHWGCPMRERWGLCAHQQLSPALEDKLAYFATVTGSYEAAAKLAAKVGCPVEDTTIWSLVQRLGQRAEAQIQERLKETPVEKSPQRAPSQLAVLMLDGFQVRFRGPGWGKKKTRKTRVEWHEAKTGVFYTQEQAVRKARGQLLEKVVVGWQGEPLELGRRLHWEAQRGGLARRGFGTWRRIAGAGRISCWIFIMPASTSGRWPRACTVRTNRYGERGWRDDCISYGTAKNKPCCEKSRRCHAAVVPPAK